MPHDFRNMPIAIIGMACRLPGADNLEQYWQLLHEGKSAITELPPQRFNPELYYHPAKGMPGKSYTKLGGYVPDRAFNRDLCPISDDLIGSSDISHLSMLEVAAAACHHAGLDPLALPVRNAGVFIGHARGSLLGSELVYSTRIEEIVQYLEHIDSFTQLSTTLRNKITRDLIDHIHEQKPRRRAGEELEIAPNGVAGLIADAFGLTGPYMAINAACASSLFALASAATALQQGQIDMAIVGGASYCSSYSLVLFSHAQALSSTGSFPFDSRADGFICSDGYGAILVKTLPRALSDGDTIYGVIKGIGISSDGRGKSLWAPRKEGQIQAIRRAYSHGLDPARLQYIEAHGTSTQLGDATEVEALAEALGNYLPSGTRIPVSSVKANIGHTIEASGMASIIKVLLSMQHGVVPPAINYRTPNPQIDWDRLPFFVPTTEMEWQAPGDGHPRRAGIDSFGIGGLDAHIVLDQQPETTRTTLSVPEKPFLDKGNAAAANDNDAVAVIGIGAIFPGASNLVDYWNLLISGSDPKSSVQRDRWDPEIYYEANSNTSWRSPTQLGGFITNFAYNWQKHKIPPKQLENADPLQFMLLEAADQALRSANYEHRSFDRSRVGVVVGTIFGGDFASRLSIALHQPEFELELTQTLRKHNVPEGQSQEMLKMYRNFFQRYTTTLNDETGSYTSSTLASRISKSLDLMGGAFALDAGESSSLAAVWVAVSLLLSGACDMVLCAGAQRAMEIDSYEPYAVRGFLSPDRPRAAFDENVNGFVPGEGTGMLLLKRLSDARRDSDPIRAVIRGVGVATDTESPGNAIFLAIKRAWDHTGIEPGNVDVVETAGTGIANLDLQEAQALLATYGSVQREDPLLLGSLAEQIGHTLGASGMASLLKMILAFEKGQIPANATVGKPIEAIAKYAATFRRLSEAVALRATPQKDSLLAGVNTFTFRGSAYHALIERPGGSVATTQIPERDWRIIRIGGITKDDVIERVLQSQADASSLLASANVSRYSVADRARLAIVVDSEDMLARKLKLAADQIMNQSMLPVQEEQGIFYREVGEEPPRIAWLFSGQGSQYTGMLRELVREVPAAATMLHEIDSRMSRLGYPTFSEIAWKEDTGMGTDVWLTQVSVLLADTIVHAALSAMGIRPDVISGHSYGEYPALLAAGTWSLEQVIRVTRARCDFINASERAHGAMLATTATPTVVDRLSARIKGCVCVANHNAPDQTIIGGDKEAVVAIDALLAAEGFENQLLPVPRPFHTPLMVEVQEPLRRVLEKEQLLPPRIPVLSSITNRYVADPLDIRKNLAEQLVTPVRYVDLIQRLANDGISIFVEVGPRQVLTRLHRRILPKGIAMIIACDNPKYAGIEQLVRVRAALECAGVAFDDMKNSEQPQIKTAINAGIKVNTGNKIIHFDATLRRKQKMLEVAESRANTTLERSSTPVPNPTNKLESFLINFVCEQTGYPVEAVGLEADLEADLGIDSIKKAQLLGELREHYNIQALPADRLALDDYPTLRHVLNFLRKYTDDTDSLISNKLAPEGMEASQIDVTAAPGNGKQATLDITYLVDTPNIVMCSGTPYEMGLQHARSQAVYIEALLKKYENLLITEQSNLQRVFTQADTYFTSNALEELTGMADALKLPIEHIIAYNIGIIAFNLGLSYNYGAGCTQFAIAAHRNRSTGMIHGANEDWPLSLSLGKNLTRIVQVRHPDNGIPHLIFSLAGQIGGLNGINAYGVAVSSTMLLDRTQPNTLFTGRIHSVIVQSILEQATDIESAIAIVKRFERVGAWSLCISHSQTDRLCYLEYDGAELEVQLDQDAVMTTNHSLLLKPLVEVQEHSFLRLSRLRSLLTVDGQGDCTLKQAQATLRDCYDLQRDRETVHPTMNTIRRIDNQISIVMQPSLGEIWTTLGPSAKESVDQYHNLKLSALFAPGSLSIPPMHQQADSDSMSTQPDARISSDEVPMDKEGFIMSRFVLRMSNTPLESRTTKELPFHGPVLILGNNPVSRALRQYLESRGVPVRELPVSDTPDVTLAALDQFWILHPLPHLFLFTAEDEDTVDWLDEDIWTRKRNRDVLLPYLVNQRWMGLISQSNLLNEATLVAVTPLRGDFGFSGNATAVEGGALAGLLKGIRHEFETLTVKIIDMLPEESPDLAVTVICDEVAAKTPEVEVGYIRGHRRLVRALPRPLTPLKRNTIPIGGTWVITGGARGVTASVALELGRRFGLSLHLIGSSPPPHIDDGWRNLSDAELKALKISITQKARGNGLDPLAAWHQVEKAIEIDKTLRTFAQERIQATYHSCDVSDRNALAKVLDNIRQSDGPIQGIVHGAGVEMAARFDRKKLENVMATISAKIDGAAALMALTREDPLKYFVAFSSVSGRFGGLGQTDYSLASDMLCKMIQRFRSERPTCASVAFHWPAWDEVGMAMRPESKLAISLSEQHFMPLHEGIEHLIDELLAGTPEGEVLILDKGDVLDHDGIMPTTTQRQSYSRRREVIAQAPLIEGVRELNEGRSLVAEVRLDPTSDIFLLEHRFQSTPMLPAVIGIESFAEAASILSSTQVPAYLHNIEIVNGFRFYSVHPQEALVHATLTASGIECELSAPFHNRQGKLVDPSRTYMTGIAEMADHLAPIPQTPLNEVPYDWYEMQYPEDDLARQLGLVFHGPSLRCLHQVSLQSNEAWGRIVTPPLTMLDGNRGGNWVTAAMVLDAALVTCSVFASRELGLSSIPRGFKSLQFGRLPDGGEVCTVHLKLHGRQEQYVLFDFVLFGSDKQAILSAKEYCTVILTKR